jgi:hypothetical protein
MTDYRPWSDRKKDVFMFCGFSAAFAAAMIFLLYLGLS